MIRRICLFGGPGVGKSTSAAWLYSQLKMRHYQAEFVQEYVKTLAYEGRVPEGADQIWLLGKQTRREDVLLRNGVDVVVTDSPVLMSTCYAKKYGSMGWQHLMALSDEFDKVYKPLNIFLDRMGKSYDQNGRYQDEEQAKELDGMILAEASKRGCHVMPYNNVEGILALILEQVPLQVHDKP